MRLRAVQAQLLGFHGDSRSSDGDLGCILGGSTGRSASLVWFDVKVEAHSRHADCARPC